MVKDKEIQLVKRDGRQESLDISKIHKVLMWACEGVDGVSVSEIETTAMLKFFNGMKTSDVQKSLIEAAHDLISEDYPNYDIVAGRLQMFDVRKNAYGQFEPPRLYDHVKAQVADGWYDKKLLDMYTEAEFDKLDSFVKHDQDFTIKIAGAKEWVTKYLIQDRTTGNVIESPQMAYILVSAILMHKYVADEGLKIVQEYYEDISVGDTTIPSPIVHGIRSAIPQGASCTLIETGDDLNSIAATAHAAMLYAANKAGLGISVAGLRGANQPVRGGEAITTGPIPFTQFIQKAIAACSQGGMRKGSVTFTHNIWHIDVENLLVLKNNKGTEESRVRHGDHCFNLNRYLFKKILMCEQITLFSPEEVPDLAKAFFDDQEKFAELYEKYSRARSIKKRFVDGAIIRDLIVGERSGTSRVYLHFVDNSNEQGAFYPESAPIRMTNLCVEVTLPTVPLKSIEDPDALISLCNLSAINWGSVKTPADLKRRCRNAVYALDALLDYQTYPVKAAQNSTDWYRPLGIGVNNLAYFLAKRGLKYDKEGAKVVDEFMEAQSYYLLEASIELAEKYGPCGKYKNVRYSDGIMPFHNRKKAFDDIVPHQERMDWSSLIERLKKSGARNATLGACMPSETSSRVFSMTNGVEPARSLIVTKGGTKLVVPGYERLKKKYDLEWDMSMEGYIYVMAAIQKWLDQAISLNTRYVPKNYPNAMIPASKILNHIAMICKYGLKTVYYNNNYKDVKSDDEQANDVVEEIVEDQDENDCESCKI